MDSLPASALAEKDKIARSVVKQDSGMENQLKHKVFGRDIPAGGRPGPKSFTPSLGGRKIKLKARTSMIRGGLRKT